MKKRPKPHRRTTALVRRRKTYPGETFIVPGLPAPKDDKPARTLDDGIAIGELGLVAPKLSKEEDAVLSRAVKLEEIRVKPSGQPYLSHPSYTRWLNEAFGRLGWSLVPVGKPSLSERSNVLMPYLLYVHGKPAAFAIGEQDYNERNREQTYGDAIEATYASGLRRVCKRLGMGLDLWDRVWCELYMRQHAVRVIVSTKYDGRKVQASRWRRKVDPPLPYEIRVASNDDDDGDVQPTQRAAPSAWGGDEAPAEPSAGSNRDAGEPITEKQVKRFWVILRNSGRNEDTVKSWLLRRYGIDSSKKIRRADYEAICRAIEGEEKLPEGRS